jgi:arabinose-5-phosphate isomerase
MSSSFPPPTAASPPPGEPHGHDAETIALGLAAAKRSLRIEADAVAALMERVEHDLAPVVTLIEGSPGRVVVSGLGKSGHVGRKMAATLASTGTPAFFIHATEALHGDAGMVGDEDVVLLISNSGETEEVCVFARLLKERNVPVVALTGGPESELARLSDAVIDISVAEEADPLNLAPTASTTATMAIGDALAAALMAIRRFGHEDFARRHPAGALGRRAMDPGAGT